MTPACPYCGADAKETTGAAIYPHIPRLHGKKLYACEPCGAWVGCYENSDKPLGRLADATLRRAKMAAHQALDPLWKGTRRRSAVYKWLARELGIPASECHIGMFDVAMCQRVITICAARQGAAP